MDRYLSALQLARLVLGTTGEAAGRGAGARAGKGAGDAQETRPYYRALADAVRGLVLDGRLAVGVRLPAERHLAEALGVSRTTVTAAYDRLREQGYLESRQGSGSRATLPDAGALGTDNPWLASDDDGLLPLHAAAPPASALLGEAIEEAGRAYHRYALGMGYHPAGLAPLREAIARRYGERGVPTRPEQILVTAGAQQAIHLLMAAFAERGDPVLVESPTYPHAIDAARMRGARLVPVGVQEDGWHLDLVTCAMRQTAARLAYVIPDFQNPTGHLMADAARAELVEAARRHGVTLIADESWAEIVLDETARAAPLAAFDTDGRVISVGSASKLWWGGLRVGWIRASAATVRRLAVLRAAVDIAGAVFEQLVVACLFERIEEARAERRRGLGASCAALAAVLREELPGWAFTTPRGGGSLWVRLDGPVASSVAEAAAARGVRLAPGPWFGVDGTLERYLRLPFTQPPAVMEEAVRRIARDPARYRPREPLMPAL
ncbi:PLP-dependent aminotransferase family protein [Microbispora sp. SCL1-1]|uniref:MocR-like transcription factor YczR n=1 Tax=unclassified Microbispora TaxID=2614687 RepID=UPI00115BE17F|nr:MULTISPECIES: PLP-dependent aminotransferase family protein [unclassified Microbispora]NJP25140.1 PLP-dependent aminotransferase family protein [Microbispora sp. CL1-1]TQS14044.1 PLP-dependent aminotransferase family protein [Microbispora sp. SCL1-1]